VGEAVEAVGVEAVEAVEEAVEVGEAQPHQASVVKSDSDFY
jgi:hypothetical protein